MARISPFTFDLASSPPPPQGELDATPLPMTWGSRSASRPFRPRCTRRRSASRPSGFDGLGEDVPSVGSEVRAWFPDEALRSRTNDRSSA